MTGSRRPTVTLPLALLGETHKLFSLSEHLIVKGSAHSLFWTVWGKSGWMITQFIAHPISLSWFLETLSTFVDSPWAFLQAEPTFLWLRRGTVLVSKKDKTEWETNYCLSLAVFKKFALSFDISFFLNV